MIWFISDEHFYDAGIISACHRPFKNVEEMNRELISNHNALIKPEDTVYHLGDFAYGASLEMLQSVMKELHGQKHLILGNHDRFAAFEYVEIGFWMVHTALELKEIDAVLIHDPAASCINRSQLFICGHVHDFFTELKNVINVSVEVRNYRPTSLDTINRLRSTMRF